MSLFDKNPLVQSATSLFCVLSTFVFSTGMAAADTNSRQANPPSVSSVSSTSNNVAPLVQFLSPESSKTVESTTVEVKLRLKGPRINSRSLKIFANGQNVTNSFSIGDCPWGLCEVSGRLTLGAGLKSGWNTLLATVSTKSGAVGRSRLRFYEKTGLGDPTTGYAPPQAVHVYMSPTQGIEVDYTPDGGNTPYFYPGGCNSGSLTMIRLNRSTLAYESIGCYGPNDNAKLQNDLSTFTEQDVLLASTGGALGLLNLSPIGGTDFTASNAPTAYSYSIIGYGQASAGVAAESYNTTSDAAWHGLEGNLLDIGLAANGGDLYGFQPTSSAGFAIVPNGLNATVTVGNPQNLPIANATLTNVPAGFSNVTYSAPPFTGSGGGLWVLVLDRYTLGLVSSTTYSARNPDNSENQSQVLDLLNGISQLDNNSHLVFITTLVGSDTSGNYGSTPLNTQQGSVNQHTNALFYIIRMGVSPYAFDRAMGLQWGLGYSTGSAFSMVGVPNQFIAGQLPNKVSNSGVSCGLPATSTLVCGGNKDQWFSSALDTQGNETGALRGTLTRNRAFQYTPTDVTPFTPANNATTADQLLSNSIAHAVATAPLVAWPMTDTPGHKAAYAYLSNELNSQDFNSGKGCIADATYCQDIRFYYTSDQNGGIITGTDPKTIPCPANRSDFVQQDCTDVAQQLSSEKGYLGDVTRFQTAIETIHSDTNANLALELTIAANDVVKQVTDATPIPNVGADPMSLSIDSLGLASGITGIIGAVVPAAGVLSGILSSAGGILSIIKDSQKSTTDPNAGVKTLADLYTGSSTAAAQAAIDFSTNLTKSTSQFFDGVYSDWFKLETIGLLSQNPDNQGSWYFKDSIDGTYYAPYLQAAARKNFYEQILGQHFSTIYVQTFGAAPRNTGSSVIPGLYPNTMALWSKLVQKNNLSNVDHAYSWNYRDTFRTDGNVDGYPVGDGVWDFNFVVLNNNHQQGWTDALGNTLMGPPNSSDGSGNLNLNWDMLYDSGIFPTISSTFWNSADPGN